jgi:hypothetical protein
VVVVVVGCTKAVKVVTSHVWSTLSSITTMSYLSHQADFNSRAGHPPKLYLPSQMMPIHIDGFLSPELHHAMLSTFSSHQDVFSTEQSNNHASSSRNHRYTSPGPWNLDISCNSLTLVCIESAKLHIANFHLL